ncbi:hypothetical protein [Pediococcus argentinicus]|uniref:Uncharacterized protein n=1 Tax=Pediococcus argentinicus TaxID=480391 RepID=A0A0R2NCA5_9LACO|nr:hypothetical protein [Pediococcus argentinicus]KRO23521.1 hypothetical protein IV88_GL000918 [Pediococcus argentinicus]NKZ22914.1 hypothetical protein [Pediococcus argentinicus]GEP19953.1 hypothetical protein LSA03_13370 [Pediococcus argentinicus]
MKIAATQAIQILKDENVTTKDFKVTKVSLKKADSKPMEPVWEFLKTATEDKPLLDAAITVNKDVTVRLQTSIINLPLRYVSQAEKILDDQDYDLNIYAIIEAEAINSSHLRIDQIGTIEDVQNANKDLRANFHDWINEQFDRLDNGGEAKDE